MYWQWIWTAMSLDWHMIGNAFVHEWLWIDIGLAMDWYKIVNGLVPKLCVMGGLLGLDWNRIDLKLHWAGTEFTPQGYGVATSLALVWHWIDIKLAKDWHWIYINLTRMWWGLASQLIFIIEIVLNWIGITLTEFGRVLARDCHKIDTGLAQDLDRIDTPLTPRWWGLAVFWL